MKTKQIWGGVILFALILCLLIACNKRLDSEETNKEPFARVGGEGGGLFIEELQCSEEMESQNDSSKQLKPIILGNQLLGSAIFGRRYATSCN